jgi:UPF0176 protein
MRGRRAGVTSVVTFYKFVRLLDPSGLRDELDGMACELALKGTILLAGEGINGTVTGNSVALQKFLGALERLPEFSGLAVKYSSAAAGNPVFHRLKVRVKPEIVSFGVSGLDPGGRTGTHVGAEEWNELLDDPEVTVVDTRNDYEVAIGSFPSAVNPATQSFRQFADFVADHLDPDRDTRVAMFCTGGIRCEKASAYLLERGFAEVYQLDGGILNYLETVKGEANRWEGECFVFDQRVSVDRHLREGSYEQCFACRRPLSTDDLQSPDYRPGISCPHCAQEQPEARRAALAERARQVALAARRGEAHIGVRQGSQGRKNG